MKYLLLLLFSLYGSSAAAVDREQYGAINELGRLNGIALHCGFIEETQRMKLALVENLPKRRELGLRFDQVTNDSFLNFMKSDEICPDRDSFSGIVDNALQRLKQAFDGESVASWFQPWQHFSSR